MYLANIWVCGWEGVAWATMYNALFQYLLISTGQFHVLIEDVAGQYNPDKYDFNDIF